MQKNSTKIITSPEMQSVSPGWFLTEAMLSAFKSGELKHRGSVGGSKR